MADQPRRSLLSHYWGSILGAAAQRTGVARAWDIVKAAADAEGKPLPAGGLMEMNRLYSRAVKAREATIVTDQIGAPRTLTSADIAEDISYRPKGPGEVQHYAARYEHIFTDEEGTQQAEWRWLDLGANLPVTDAEAYQEIDQEAQGLEDEYHIQHEGVGRFQLLRM